MAGHDDAPRPARNAEILAGKGECRAVGAGVGKMQEVQRGGGAPARSFAGTALRRDWNDRLRSGDGHAEHRGQIYRRRPK